MRMDKLTKNLNTFESLLPLHCQFLQLLNEKRSVEQLKSDLQNERSKSQDESQRLHQDIVLLKEEVDLTKRDLQEVQQINLQFKSEVELASEELDRARHVHEDQTSEVCLLTI